MYKINLTRPAVSFSAPLETLRSVSNWLVAWLAYGLYGRLFGREHSAVWAGRRAYRSGHAKTGRDSTWLRRNVHRIEKGLIMRPRKDIFAQDYILETVHCFRRCVSDDDADLGELRWAEDVLASYFAVVQPGHIIESARRVFDDARNGRAATDGTAVPYRRAESPPLQFDVGALESLCRRRRSVRWFQPRQVEREKIARAVEIAKEAPSACNRQPFRFVIAEQPVHAAEIAGLAMGTRGFAENLPALAIIVGNLSSFPYERDRHVIYIDGALAAMQFMLALETLGLASCPINWPDIEVRERAMTEKLGLEDYERVVMLIGFGYPDDEGLIAYSRKRSNILQWYTPASS